MQEKREKYFAKNRFYLFHALFITHSSSLENEVMDGV